MKKFKDIPLSADGMGIAVCSKGYTTYVFDEMEHKHTEDVIRQSSLAIINLIKCHGVPQLFQD